MIAIYVLRCPQSGAVRYVGKAADPKARLRQHLHEARQGQKSHKHDWIRSVLRLGLKPLLEVDVWCDEAAWKDVERARISHWRASGADLTNYTDGGDGATDLSSEKRLEISARMKRIRGTPEARAQAADMMLRCCSDPDWVRARADSAKAARSTPEYKARASERSKARWRDPEYVARMKAARQEVISRPEYRERLSASTKKAMADPGRKAQLAESVKAAWANPEMRARRVAAIKAGMAAAAGAS